ncbi:MAG: class I SAM-dependent methyltransferase [Acidimicrobiia bacterium]
MRTEAREAWRRALDSWALPERLLAGVDDSPFSWPAHLYERMIALDSESPVVAMAAGLMGDGGSVLDVGAGAGRLALPLAERGHRVTAVERDEGMAQALGDAAGRAGLDVTRIVGTWPQVAGNAGIHDLCVSGHVVFDVPAIGPFLEAMNRCARRAVIIEMTPRHPWSGLSRYYRALHGIDRPTRPTVDDFVRVVEEVVGVAPEVEWRTVPAAFRFADTQELLEFYRRRLLVPPARSLEAAAILEPDIHRLDDGWLVLGAPEREVVTVRWSRS